MKKLFLNKGDYLFSLLNRKTRDMLNLTKWVKDKLNDFQIAFHDPCCECDTQYAPVKYNKTTQRYEYYDCDSETWEIVSPDLLAQSSSDLAAIAEGGTAVITHTVSNIGSVPTKGAILALINKPINGTNLVTSLPAGWTVVTDEPNGFIIRTTKSLESGDSEDLEITYTHDGTNEDAIRIFNCTVSTTETEDSLLNNISAVNVQIL